MCVIAVSKVFLAARQHIAGQKVILQHLRLAVIPCWLLMYWFISPCRYINMQVRQYVNLVEHRQAHGSCTLKTSVCIVGTINFRLLHLQSSSAQLLHGTWLCPFSARPLVGNLQSWCINDGLDTYSETHTYNDRFKLHAWECLDYWVLQNIGTQHDPAVIGHFNWITYQL